MTKFTGDMDRALSHAWNSGESMDDVARRLKIGRSTLYRRAKELELETRHPEKRRRLPYQCLPWIPEHAHPLVRQLFHHMRGQGISIPQLAGKVGITREAVGAWRLHSSPMLVNFEAALNVVGCELIIRERSPG